MSAITLPGVSRRDVPAERRSCERGPHACGACRRPARVVRGAACGTTKTTKHSNRLFAPTSVWNAPVVHAASTRRPPAAWARSSRRSGVRSIGHRPVDLGRRHSTPIYVVPPAHAASAVKLDTGSWGASCRRRSPRRADSAGCQARGRDGRAHDGLPTVDRHALGVLEGRAKRDGWHASWGGAMNTSRRIPATTPSRHSPGSTAPSGWNWGATATSLPVIAGTVRIRELRAGVVPHALAMAIPEACAKSLHLAGAAHRRRTRTPATACPRAPTSGSTRARPREARPPACDPRPRQGSPALRDHRPRRHAPCGRLLRRGPDADRHEPLPGPHGLYDGLKPWNFLPQFPWAQLQLLKLTQCTAAPCLPRPPRTTSNSPLQIRGFGHGPDAVRANEVGQGPCGRGPGPTSIRDRC